MAKALRFYQLAFQSYTDSIGLPGDVNLDSYYNSLRLLFHVYNQFVKAEGVELGQLKNLGLTNDDNSVVQSLNNIQRAHETALSIAERHPENIPLDLLFNAAAVYIEVLEEEDAPFPELLDVTVKAVSILSSLLDFQSVEFEKFYAELQNYENGTNVTRETNISTDASEYNDTDELTSDQVVQPTDIFESILSSYNLARAILEATESTDLHLVISATGPLLLKCDIISQDLIAKFSEMSVVKNEMVSNIGLDQINELQINKAYVQGLTHDDISKTIELWKGELPNTSERFMLAADNLQGYLDRNDITLEKVSQSQDSADKDTYWTILSAINTNLKSAQILLQATLQTKKGQQEQLGVGTLISQISGVLIARADIDLQRCQIKGYEQAEKNQEILITNAKTLLKNAMTIANTNGGLRERVSEKLQREKKRVDAVIRMCLLENKRSISELDSILGRDRWVSEIPVIKDLGYYSAFGVDGITTA